VRKPSQKNLVYQVELITSLQGESLLLTYTIDPDQDQLLTAGILTTQKRTYWGDPKELTNNKRFLLIEPNLKLNEEETITDVVQTLDIRDIKGYPKVFQNTYQNQLNGQVYTITLGTTIKN